MKQNDVVALKGGVNLYRVCEVQGKTAQLECIKFEAIENLGDGIMASRQGSKNWIAHEFFGHRFTKVT